MEEKRRQDIDNGVAIAKVLDGFVNRKVTASFTLYNLKEYFHNFSIVVHLPCKRIRSCAD